MNGGPAGGSLALARFGSFFAGGRALRIDGRPVDRLHISDTLPDFRHDPNGGYVIESCYVQYFIPEPCTGLPVVLIHGGGFSGACWETTPDGRPGWTELLLRRGRAVYVLDMVERGRAGWCALPGVWPDPPIMRTAEEAWRVFRFGDAADFAARRGFPGLRFPLESFPAFLRQFVPRWPGSDGRAQPALQDAIRIIGRCAIVAHSSGAGLAYQAAMEAPDLVAAVATLEPNGTPRGMPADLSGQRFVAVFGDYLDRDPLWLGLHAGTCEMTRALAGRGARASCLTLADAGLPGHSHMLMMDRGSDRVLALTLSAIDDAAGD
ncbi:MAG: hypothetical protein RIB84_18655 [Sneathiellaceae bacterium]